MLAFYSPLTSIGAICMLPFSYQLIAFTHSMISEKSQNFLSELTKTRVNNYKEFIYFFNN